jgi:hypothetical protein
MVLLIPTVEVTTECLNFWLIFSALNTVGKSALAFLAGMVIAQRKRLFIEFKQFLTH